MIRTIKGHSILEYQAPEDWQDQGGIILPSAAQMRHMLRQKEQKVLDVDAPPPDIYRFGKYVTGDLQGAKEGDFVYFNKHDAEEFEHEGTTYHRINNKNALAFLRV